MHLGAIGMDKGQVAWIGTQHMHSSSDLCDDLGSKSGGTSALLKKMTNTVSETITREQCPPTPVMRNAILGESLGISHFPQWGIFLTLALSFPKARCVHILFIPVLIKVTPLFAKVAEQI